MAGSMVAAIALTWAVKFNLEKAGAPPETYSLVHDGID